MAKYPIKELERLSGIKAHTIRIWEKRYGILKPDRTNTNFRFYNDDELKHLLNIVILNKSGIKISKIAKLTPAQLKEKVLDISSDLLTSVGNIENLIIAMIEMDEAKFDRILSRYVMNLGFENTILNIIFPFLEQLGILWQTGSINIAHEHFAANLLRQKLLVAIDNIVIPDKTNGKKFILFLPEGEYHELALLFYNYLIKKSGKIVYYLGNSIPFEDIIKTGEMVKPDFLFLSLTTSLKICGIDEYLKDLSEAFPSQKIFITSPVIKNNNTDLPANIITVISPTDIVEFLKN